MLNDPSTKDTFIKAEEKFAGPNGVSVLYRGSSVLSLYDDDYNYIYLLQPTMQSGRLPIFESLCILLYMLEPKDLIHFVAYTHMVRESQHGDASFIRRTVNKVYLRFVFVFVV